MSWASFLSAFGGAIIGLIGAFSLTVIAKWRENERVRQDLRSYISLLKLEICIRLERLSNKTTDRDLAEYGDAFKQINFESSGITFDYSNELARYRLIFDVYANKILELRPEVATSIYQHYVTIEERLMAFMERLPNPSNYSTGPFDILGSVRDDTNMLIKELDLERDFFARRNFGKWFLLWIIGKS